MSKTVKRGRCPSCRKEPRIITSVDPVTGENVCRTCYRKTQERNPELVVSKKRLAGRSTVSSPPASGRTAGSKINTCPECKKGPKELLYRHPKTGERICPTCYQRHRLRGRKIEPETGPVQSPVAASHPEIRHPGDLIGKEVMEIGSLRVGTIVGADFKGVEVDFNGARERYGQRKLNDLVLFTEAAEDFKEERLAADRKP